MSYVQSASPATLRKRAEINARIRAFFATRGVLEVETPALSRAGVSDLALESVAAQVRRLGSTPLYLHTSPEYAMKRLLAAGLGDIYQLCRVFRDDELGRWHQPEFTLLEWYRVGWDEHRLMDEVEALLQVVLADSDSGGDSREDSRSESKSDSTGSSRGNSTSGPPRRAVRVTYADAFRRCLAVEPTAAGELVSAALRGRGIDVPAGLTHDALLDLAFSTAVVQSFAADALTFVHDYPASQAALARIKPTSPPVAARFEVFARGIELANGFHELTDSAEQRARFETELDARRRAGRAAPPLDEALLEALRQLPPCAGVAVGVDRLVALAAGLDGVAPAVSFAHENERR